MGLRLAKKRVEGQAPLLTDLTELGIAITGMCSSRVPAHAGLYRTDQVSSLDMNPALTVFGLMVCGTPIGPEDSKRKR